nr:MAG TPA: Type I site specific restriction modification protein [Caudoviricetes sp.]
MELRGYQQIAVNAVYDYMRKSDLNPCVVLPTGAGKSIVIAKIVTDAVTLWQGRCLILAHVKELLEQNAAKIAALCPEIDIGIFSAGLNSRNTRERVIVAGIQSVYDKAAQLGSFDLVLIDEAHLIPPDGDGMYRSFLDDMKKINPNIRLIGLTATPYRLKGGLICRKENLLNEVCCEIGVRELIVAGYLSKLRSKNGKYKADLDNLHIRGGEFVAEDVEKAMDNERLVTASCREIAELCKDRKKVLIFASSIDHCRHIAETIREQTHEECGIVTGHTPKLERAEILDRFRGITQKNLFGEAKPELKYLVNVGVLTTGFDAPAIDCVAILRPTNSAGLYYQMVGRGFRLSPDTGKTDCLILDYGGNIMRHGPVDMIRITGDPGRKGNGGAPVRECPQCQSVFPAGRTACPDCGYEFPREDRKLRHDSRACSDGILSGESSELEYPVKDVYYCTHTKRNADEGTPKTMRIDYMIGFNDFQAEWVCPEHTGYARRKFEKWWRERTEIDPPGTAAECVQIAQKGYLKKPVAITVKTTAGQRFPEIVKYTFAENEPDAEEAALIAALAEDTAEGITAAKIELTDEDVPF